jgi:hypothetical protein
MLPFPQGLMGGAWEPSKKTLFQESEIFSLRTSIYFSLFGGKVKLNVKFTLEQATKAQRRSRGIVLLFL